MNQKYSDTIAAISTAVSSSGIGIVRMTGKEAFEIADKIYVGKKEKKLGIQKLLINEMQLSALPFCPKKGCSWAKFRA